MKLSASELHLVVLLCIKIMYKNVGCTIDTQECQGCMCRGARKMSPAQVWLR